MKPPQILQFLEIASPPFWPRLFNFTAEIPPRSKVKREQRCKTITTQLVSEQYIFFACCTEIGWDETDYARRIWCIIIIINPSLFRRAKTTESHHGCHVIVIVVLIRFVNFVVLSLSFFPLFSSVLPEFLFLIRGNHHDQLNLLCRAIMNCCLTSSLSSWILSVKSYSLVFSSFFFFNNSNRFLTWSTEERSTFMDMPKFLWSESE